MLIVLCHMSHQAGINSNKPARNALQCTTENSEPVRFACSLAHVGCSNGIRTVSVTFSINLQSLEDKHTEDVRADHGGFPVIGEAESPYDG